MNSNLDVERLVLGSIMLNESVYVQVAEVLQASDFSLEKHRRILARMKDIYDRGGKIDRVTVADELIKQGQLESVDGLGYLVSLDEGLPEIVNIESYIRIVQDKSTRRKTILAARKLALLAQDETESIGDVIANFIPTLSDITLPSIRGRGAIGTDEMIQEFGLQNLLSQRDHGEVRLPFMRLDQALRGLSGGQMVVIMAATSRGKTSLALQIAAASAAQDLIPSIWTLEMSRRSMFQRLISQISQVDLRQRVMSFEDRHALQLASLRLQEHPVHLDSDARNVAGFVANLRRLKARRGLGLAVVDHLQLIRSGNSHNRAQEVSDNSRALKNAATDLDIPFLVLSQVDRGSVKGDGEIGLHSAKESGDVENDADVVMWIKAEEEFSRDRANQVSLRVGKQREGPSGFSISMVFMPGSQTFMEVSDERES